MSAHNDKDSSKNIRIPGLNLKNVKIGNTEDGGSLYANLYLDKTLICKIEDDGMGGPENFIYVSDEAKNSINNLINQHQIRQQLFATEYQYLDSIDEMTHHDALLWLVNTEANAISLNKIFKSMKRKCDTSIVICDHDGDARFMVWKAKNGRRRTLTEVSALKGGRDGLQRSYDKMVQSIKEGEFILNSPNQLSGLGVKVNLEKHFDPTV